MSIQGTRHCETTQLCVLAERDQLRADKAELLSELKRLTETYSPSGLLNASAMIAKHENMP